MGTQKKQRTIDKTFETLEEIALRGGVNPVIFLDTSAVISYEEALRKSGSTSRDFYEQLRKTEFPFFVTGKILQEVENHHYAHNKNGRAEISQAAFDAVKIMHSDYRGAREAIRGVISQKELENLAVERDKIRYDVWLASQMAFNPEHKKFAQDPISRADKSLVAGALYLIHCLPSQYKHQGYVLPASSATIFSNDAHISETVRVLSSKDFNYQGIKVYRGD